MNVLPVVVEWFSTPDVSQSLEIISFLDFEGGDFKAIIAE